MPVFFKNKRIASYIRTGLSFQVKESQQDWFCRTDTEYLACALGLAIAGKLGLFIGHQTYMQGLVKNGGDEIQTISEILQIDPLLAEEINKLHNLDVPAEEIAECLEFEIGEDVLDTPA